AERGEPPPGVPARQGPDLAGVPHRGHAVSGVPGEPAVFVGWDKAWRSPTIMGYGGSALAKPRRTHPTTPSTLIWWVAGAEGAADAPVCAFPGLGLRPEPRPPRPT